MQLAVQEWRADFRVTGRDVEVLALRSGYRASQLQQAGDGQDPRLLHREFVARFGLPGAAP
jgi:hypothetical protein